MQPTSEFAVYVDTQKLCSSAPGEKTNFVELFIIYFLQFY